MAAGAVAAIAEVAVVAAVVEVVAVVAAVAEAEAAAEAAVVGAGRAEAEAVAAVFRPSWDTQRRRLNRSPPVLDRHLNASAPSGSTPSLGVPTSGGRLLLACLSYSQHG